MLVSVQLCFPVWGKSTITTSGRGSEISGNEFDDPTSSP